MPSDLGEHLRSIRNERKLTLRDVELETGISNAYLSQIENGKISRPSPEVLHKLSEFYSLSYENLMQLAGYPTISSAPQIVAFRTSSKTIELTKEEEKELLDYLRFLRSRRVK